MLLRLLFADGKGAVMQVELLPDLCQEQVYLEFIVCRRRLYHLIDLPDLTDDVPVPVGFLPEPERMPGFIRDDKIYVLRLQEAVLISVDEPWMKGDRQVVAVCSILHITGMKGIAVAEQSVPFFQQVFLIVHRIFDLPGHDPGKLDLRMPVPGKGILFVGLYLFKADMDGKFIIPMILDLFLVFFRV